MERYRKMMRVLNTDIQRKFDLAKGYAAKMGVRQDTAKIIDNLSLNTTNMAKCIDNYIAGLACSNEKGTYVKETNVMLFETFLSYFETDLMFLAKFIDENKHLLKGGENSGCKLQEPNLVGIAGQEN